MTGIEEQNPLRSQLADDLANSTWLQTFKAINQLLHRLKAEVKGMSNCDLRWDTSCNGLVIHYPSLEVEQTLLAQRDKILAIATYADRVTLAHPNGSMTILKG